MNANQDHHEIDHCAGCGVPLDAPEKNLEAVLEHDDGVIYFQDGGCVDTDILKDIRARARTVASILDVGEPVTAEQLYFEAEWEAYAEECEDMIETVLNYLAEADRIPFEPMPIPELGIFAYVYTGDDEE